MASHQRPMSSVGEEAAKAAAEALQAAAQLARPRTAESASPWRALEGDGDACRAVTQAGSRFSRWLSLLSPTPADLADICEQCDWALQRLYDTAWLQLHSKNKPGHSGARQRPSQRAWREAFALCCLMRCCRCCCVLPGQEDVADNREQAMKTALRLVDLALIVGGSETRLAPALFSAADELSSLLAATTQPQPQSPPPSQEYEEKERPGPFASRACKRARSDISLLTRGVRDTTVNVRYPVAEVCGQLPLEVRFNCQSSPE